MRDWLHALAPLPWTVDSNDTAALVDADGRHLFTVNGPGSFADDVQIAAALIELVNRDATPTEPTPRAEHVVAAVLGAARHVEQFRTRNNPEFDRAVGDLAHAVRVLDASPGGAT